MLYYLVLVIHILVSLMLILVVLLQSGKSGDLASAFGGAGTQTVFGPRGTSNVLTKATTISAVLFMLTSMALVALSQPDRARSVVTQPAGQSTPAKPATPGTPAPLPAPAPTPQNQGQAPVTNAPAEPGTPAPSTPAPAQPAPESAPEPK